MNFLSSAGAELSALCCQTSSAPHPAARRGWPGARPALLQPAAPAARRAERTGEPEDPQVAERSARAGSGGWRGEPTREIKGQNGGNLCTMRSEKLKSWSSVSPREGGAAVGGDGWVLLELGGARGGGFRGNFYRLLQHHLLLSQSRDAELCTSIESGLQSAGRAGRAGGGSERVSWASPGALTRESQPPEKRKVKEERGSEGEINISGGRGGGGRDGGSCWMTNLGDAAPRPLRWQAHWRARRAGGRRSRSAGAQPRPVPPWVPAEKAPGGVSEPARRVRRAGHGAGGFPVKPGAPRAVRGHTAQKKGGNALDQDGRLLHPDHQPLGPPRRLEEGRL